MNMGVFPSGQWGQTVNLLLNASVVRIHQLPPKACDKKDVTGLFLCCIVEKWRFRQPIFGHGFTVLSNHFGAVCPPWCPLFCRFLEFGRGGGNFFEKKQNKSCCFQNVFNFPAANFLLAVGIFCFFGSFQFVFKFSILYLFTRRRISTMSILPQ